MSRLLFTPLARRDLEEIHDYIAMDSPATALRFIRRLQGQCKSIARTPGMGRRREELASGLRSVAEGNYVIFYRPDGDGVQIMRILHGARDVANLFEQSEAE